MYNNPYFVLIMAIVKISRPINLTMQSQHLFNMLVIGIDRIDHFLGLSSQD